MAAERHDVSRSATLRERAYARVHPVVKPAWAYWTDLLRRMVEVQMVDRGVALGAQAFTAIVPLLMLFAVIAPRKEGSDFVETIVSRFRLSGESAAAMREAFQPPSTVTSQSISVFGAFLLIAAALSFTRTLQRLYENSYGLKALGLRGTPWGLLWIAMLGVATAVNPVIRSVADGLGLAALVISIALSSVVWSLTPYILTAKRISKAQAIPAGMLGGVAMTLLSISSTLWLPRTVAESAEQYGLIGVAFAFVSWLVVAGLTLASTAVAGAVLAEHLGFAPNATKSADLTPPSPARKPELT